MNVESQWRNTHFLLIVYGIFMHRLYTTIQTAPFRVVQFDNWDWWVAHFGMTKACRRHPHTFL
jgi:hypothetical protein